MDSEIGLLITVQIQLPHRHTAGNGRLEYRRTNGFAVPLDLTRPADADSDHFHMRKTRRNNSSRVAMLAMRPGLTGMSGAASLQTSNVQLVPSDYFTSHLSPITRDCGRNGEGGIIQLRWLWSLIRQRPD